MRNKVGAFFFLGWGNRWMKGKPMTHVAIFLQFGAQVGILWFQASFCITQTSPCQVVRKKKGTF
jgi:hypothetical protein